MERAQKFFLFKYMRIRTWREGAAVKIGNVDRATTTIECCVEDPATLRHM